MAAHGAATTAFLGLGAVQSFRANDFGFVGVLLVLSIGIICFLYWARTRALVTVTASGVVTIRTTLRRRTFQVDHAWTLDTDTYLGSKSCPRLIKPNGEKIDLSPLANGYGLFAAPDRDMALVLRRIRQLTNPDD